MIHTQSILHLLKVRLYPKFSLCACWKALWGDFLLGKGRMQRTTSREPRPQGNFSAGMASEKVSGTVWINQRAFSTHHLCWHKKSKQGSTKGLPPQAPIPWHQLDHVPVSAASRKLEHSHGSISKRNLHTYIQIDFTVNNPHVYIDILYSE